MAKNKSRATQEITYTNVIHFANITSPFTVPAGSPQITNLIAEKVGSLEASDIATQTDLATKAPLSHTHTEYVTKAAGVLNTEPDSNSNNLSVPTTSWVRGRIDEAVFNAGAGDMSKATYDTDDNGSVDKADALYDGTNIYTPSMFAKRANNNIFTASQTIAHGTASENAIFMFQDSDFTNRGYIGKIRTDSGNENISIFNMVSDEGIILKDSGGIFYSKSNQYKKIWTEDDMTPVSNAGDSIFGNLIISSGIAGSETELLTLLPTDYGTGKPKLIFKEGNSVNEFIITLWDGTDASGEITLGASSVNIGGHNIWHSGNFNPNNYSMTTHTHSNYLDKTSGGILSGTTILANGIELQGVTTTSENKKLIVLNASDQIEIGDTTIPLILNSNSHLLINIGNNNYSIWDSGNLDPNSYSLTGHTHSDATESIDGFMSHSDKTKLNGIALNANNYTHPATHPASIINLSTTTLENILNGASTSQDAFELLDDHTHDDRYSLLSHTHTTKRCAVFFISDCSSTGWKEPKLMIPFTGTITKIQYRCGTGSGGVSLYNSGNLVANLSASTSWHSNVSPSYASLTADSSYLQLYINSTSSMTDLIVEITINTNN